MLSLKFHKWNETEESSHFTDVSSSAEFVAKWKARCTDVVSSPECSSSQSQSRKRSLSLSPTPTPTPTSPPAASTSVLSNPSPVHATLEDVSPTKRSKYIKEGIDESIERGRKGDV